VNVLCGNEITRATNTNRICAAQGTESVRCALTLVGFLVIFSTHAVVRVPESLLT
jgi:hypothetical protein